jgi:transcriptional regulator with XRE-family HTH domain
MSVGRIGGPGAEPPDTVVVPRRIFEGDFAGWLRDEMTARRMTMGMLAFRSGVDHTTISRLLRHERQPMLRTLGALLSVLGPVPFSFPRETEPEAIAPVGVLPGAAL